MRLRGCRRHLVWLAARRSKGSTNERCQFLTDAWAQGLWGHAPVEGARAVMRDLRGQDGIVCVVSPGVLGVQVLFLTCAVGGPPRWRFRRERVRCAVFG